MLKKSLIFGSVALFLTALIALTGCSQGTDSETVYRADNYIYGKADAAIVQTAVDFALANGRDVVLTDQLQISQWENGIIDFKNATVRVEGVIVLKGEGTAHLVVNASRATLDYDKAGKILLNDRAIFIYQGDGEYIEQTSDSADKVKFTTAPKGDFSNITAIAMNEWTLSTAVADPNDIADQIKRVYILDTLTIPAGSKTYNRQFRVVGKADFTGNYSISGPSSLDFMPKAVLGAGTSGITVSIPTPYPLPTVNADNNFTISAKVTGANEYGINIKEVVGAGTLTLEFAPGTYTTTSIKIGENDFTDLTKPVIDGNSAKIVLANVQNATDVNITNNENGEVIFASALLPTKIKSESNKGTIRFADTVAFNGTSVGDIAFDGSGKVIFESDTTFTTATTINNNVEFKGPVTCTLGVVLGGNVWLAGGKTITFTSGVPFTLKAGKTFTLGKQGSFEDVDVWKAGTDVVITPGGTTTLGGTSIATLDEEVAAAVARTLTLGGASAAWTGNLTLVGGIFALDGNFTYTISDGTAPALGALTLAGGVLQFDDNISNMLQVGTTAQYTVSGVAAGVSNLNATASVKLALDGISGSGILYLGDAGEDEGGGIAPLIDVPSAKALAIKGVDVNLEKADGTLSGLRLTYSSVSTVTLSAGDNPGKLTFVTEGFSTPRTGLSVVSIGAVSVGTGITLSGNGVFTIDSDETVDEALPSAVIQMGALSGSPISAVTLTSGNTTILANGASLKLPASP
jgi:hypothetical protein